MNKPRLYTTPFIVGWIMLAVGLLGAFNMAYVPLFIPEYDGFDGGFAFTLVGGFVVIMAIVVFAVYGKLNNDFRKMLAGDTLLTYVMPYDMYSYFSREKAEEIRGGNKAALIMILFFCVLFGVIFGLAMDILFIFICLGIAVFFTIIYFVTTAYRTKKLKRAQALVCLNGGGAYILGEMHSWSLVGAWMKSVSFIDNPATGLPCPVIQISYMALSGTIPQEHTVTIPVPPQMAQQGYWAAGVLKSSYGV